MVQHEEQQPLLAASYAPTLRIDEVSYGVDKIINQNSTGTSDGSSNVDVLPDAPIPTKGEWGNIARSQSGNDVIAYETMMRLSVSINPLRYKTCRSLIIWFITSCILFLTNQLTTLPVGFFPIYAEQTFNMTPFQLTLFFSIYPLCIMISSPLAAAASTVLGRQTLICVGMVLSGMSTIAFAYSRSIESVYLLRMGQGLGAGSAVVGAFSMITEEFSSTIGHVLVIQECIVASAFITAPPVGSLLFEYYGFQIPFLVSGVAQLLVVMIVPMLFIEYALPDTPYSRWQKLTSVYTTAYSNRVGFRDVITPTCTICLVLTVFAMGSFGFIDPYLGSHLQTVLGAQHTAIGVGFGLSAFVYFIGGVVYVWLSRSCGCKQVILFGLLQLSVGFFFLGPAPFLNDHFTDFNRLWSTQWLSLICIGCGAALATAPGLPLTLMSVAEPGSHTFNLIIGLFSAAVYLGQAIGPFLALGSLKILPVTHSLNCFVTADNECMSSLPWAFTLYSFLALGMFGIVAYKLRTGEVVVELLEQKRRVSLHRQASEYGQFVFFDEESND